MSEYTEDNLVQQTTAEYVERYFKQERAEAICLFLSFGRAKSFNQTNNNLQSDAIGLTIGSHENP